MNVQHGPSCHTLYGKGYGNVDSDVVIVGIAPGKQEQRLQKPFVGASGKFLDATLKTNGLNREDYYATNLVCWVENEPTDDEIARCADRLTAEIKAIKPKVIVAVGTKPIERFVPNYPASKTRGIAMWSDEFECWVIGTWHPSFILQMQSENLARDFLTDLSKIPHYLNPNAHKCMGFAPYTLVDSASDVNLWLANRDLDDFLTLDVETSYDGTKLRSFAMAQGDDCIVVTNPEQMVGKIDWQLERNLKWTFQNLMFDVAVIDKFFGVRLTATDDTMYMSYCLDERAGEGDESYDVGVGIHGLKKLAGAWCGCGIYDINTEEASDEQLWPYNAKDAIYTYRLAHLLHKRLVEDDVERPYRQLVSIANKAWRSKKRGIYVDKQQLARLGMEWSARWLELEEQLREMAYDAGFPEPREGTKDKAFNANSHPMLKTLIYDIMGLPVNRSLGKNTQAKTLKESYPDNKFVVVLLEWRGIDKDMKTYVRGTFDALDDKGFIHPDPVLHATVTQRWVYKNPPMQTIPQARNVGESRARLRRVFTVEPQTSVEDERELLEGDYSQSEVWWAAYYGKDEQMFKDLQSGDFHAGVTESVFKIKKDEVSGDVWKKKRGDSKYVTFGVMFGRQKKALQKAEMKDYTVDEVGEFIQNWYERYKHYVAWRMSQQKDVKEKGEQQALNGAKRRYPIIFNYSAFNQAFNFPVQCVSHANLVATFDEVFDTLIEKWDAWVLLEVHDALLIDMPKKHRKEVAAYVKEVAERNRYGISVPMEFKVGPNMLDMQELKVG